MSATRRPATNPAPATVLQLRQALVEAARRLADAMRPQWGGEAVVTVLVRNGGEASAAVRFPSVRE